MSDWNTKIIEEFRENDGELGGNFAGRTLLLLHHTGARSGVERVSPLAYQQLDPGWAVFASKGGADTNPAWFHNLMANPETVVEIGSETVDVRARLADPGEHESIWERQKREVPVFAEYEAKTARKQIPVVILEPT